MHARPAGAEIWTLHATGWLAAAGQPALPQPGWPPAAPELDLTDAYQTLADRGYHYGPAFRGLLRAWQAGERTYAEVALPEPVREHAEDFSLHPALLDAALHALLLAAGSQELVLPFCWTGVSVIRSAAASLRVSFTDLAEDQLEFAAHDAAGQPIATGSLTLRRAPNLELAVSTPSAELPRVLDWVAADAVAEPDLTGQHWAVIGSGQQADQLVAELAEVGVSAACYYDLPSLAEMAATVPPVVLVPVVTPLRSSLADARSMLTQLPGPTEPSDDDLRDDVPTR